MRPLVLTPLFYKANNIIMNKTKYQLQDIKDFFGAQKIATLNQLKAALGNPARATLFRKLAQLEYFEQLFASG